MTSQAISRITFSEIWPTTRWAIWATWSTGTATSALSDTTVPNLRPHIGTRPHTRLDFTDEPSPTMHLVAREQWVRTRGGKDHLLQIFVKRGDLDKTEHAMNSLIASVVWDEARFNLPLDLERFMIVAVADFAVKSPPPAEPLTVWYGTARFAASGLSIEIVNVALDGCALPSFTDASPIASRVPPPRSTGWTSR